MLGQIQSELAKLIAEDIYNAAKNLSGEVVTDLKKNTKLTKKGGVPESVLAAFEDRFLSTLDSVYSRHGYAMWRHRSSKIEFDFLLESKLIAQINSDVDWAEAAKKTMEGVTQVKVLGGDVKYRDVICQAIKPVFRYAIGSCVGKQREVPHLKDAWTILTPIKSIHVAPLGTTDFNLESVFFWCRGSTKDIRTKYKLAKKLMHAGILKKEVQPSEGPYIES